MTGLDFDLTEEQREFRDAVREFAEEAVAPVAEEHDRTETFPLEVVRRMGDLGLFGLPFPERYGGLDGDFVTFCLCLEELARVDPSVAITLGAAVVLGANPVFRFGTEEQKDRWLIPMCRGKVLGSFGLTEAGAGSDAHGVRTTARLEDDEWVIDGTKAFVTNSGTPLSEVCLVAAWTGGGEISVILVPGGTSGFTVGPAHSKVGWRARDTHELVFEGCRVPEGNLLGERGGGHRELLETLDDWRIALAAVGVGLVRGCLEESVKHARESEIFGRPSGELDALRFEVADMKVAVETARLAYLKAAWLHDRGRPYGTEAAIAKLYASEIAPSCTRSAAQMHGGHGFIQGSPAARFYRDAEMLEIEGGTSETQRLFIARDLGLPSAEP